MTTKFKNAFTLAEVLITLSIIGIVAALTIPGVVKHHNEKAWATGQDLFIKKLEVALKSMNTDGKLTGYTTTVDFVNELKKNIKITKVCTDDVTKCFSKKITWGLKKEIAATIANDAITYSTRGGQDWAETVGVQFNNGITALIAYNKNCYADVYDNLTIVNDKCLGLVYDVTGNSKPNTYGNDISVNVNVTKINNKGLCVYTMANGKCITKILGPQNGGYSPFPMEINGETVTCDQAIEKGLIESQYSSCYYGNSSSRLDYWAGAQYACGGKKANMLTMGELGYLAQEMYNLSSPVGANQDIDSGLTIDPTKSAPFMTQSPGGTASYPLFSVWSNGEYGNNRACGRRFYSDYTRYFNNYRDDPLRLAVCLGD